jgi:hypothetical protein
MRDIKPKVIPIIIGATGTIPISFRKYLSNTLGKHKTKEEQKTAILDTEYTLQKVLLLKYQTFNMAK